MFITAEGLGWNIDFGLCNIGGLQSSMPKGDVTISDIMSITPYENKLSVLSVTGVDILNLLSQIAKSGGEGVSSWLRMTIASDGTLKSASIDGKSIMKNKVYNVVTIDYLAEGNDGLTALTNAIKCIDTKLFMRDVLMDYIGRQSEHGILIDFKIEGRIVVMP